MKIQNELPKYFPNKNTIKQSEKKKIYQTHTYLSTRHSSTCGGTVRALAKPTIIRHTSVITVAD